MFNPTYTKMTGLNLILLFLSLIIVDSASSSSASNTVRPELSFVSESSTLPTASENCVSAKCARDLHLLYDERSHEYTIENGFARKETFITNDYSWKNVQRGGGLSSFIPSGYNPFGYQITELGEKFLEFDGSLDSDIGRFLASVKTRKRFDAIKSQWLEILRVSKKGQSMRIYRSLEDFIKFCLKAGFLD